MIFTNIINKIRYSFKNKLIFSILSVIFISGSLAVYVVFSYSKNTLLESEKDNLKISVLEKSYEIWQIFSNAKALAGKIIEQDFLIDYLRDENRKEQDPEVLSRLESYNISEAYSSIYLIDKYGKTLVSTNKSFVGKNYSFRDYFKKSITGIPYIDVSLGVTSLKLGYYISSPVRDKNGRVFAVLVLKMKPEFINNSIHLSSINFDFKDISIIDDNGVVVFSNQNDLLYKSFVDISPLDEREIIEKRRFSGIDIKSIGYNLLRQEILNIDISEVFQRENLSNNFKEIIGIAKIGDTPFFIAATEKESKFIKKALDISLLLSLSVLLAAFFAGLTVYFLVDQFMKPFNELSEAVKKVSDGDLNQRVVVYTKDEIADLGNNFNNMTSKLQNNLKDFENRVLERTKDLEKVNKSMVGRELKMVELKKELLDLKNKKYEG